MTRSILVGLLLMQLAACASLSDPGGSDRSTATARPSSPSLLPPPHAAAGVSANHDRSGGLSAVFSGRFLLAGEQLSAPLQGRYEWVGRTIWLADPSGRTVGGFVQTPLDENSIAGWTLADAQGRSIERSRAETWAQDVLGLSADGLEELGLLLNDMQLILRGQSAPTSLSRQARGLTLRLVPDAL